METAGIDESKYGVSPDEELYKFSFVIFNYEGSVGHAKIEALLLEAGLLSAMY